MFLSKKWFWSSIFSIPLALIIVVAVLISIIYLIYLIIVTIKYKTRAELQKIEELFLEESNVIPEYEPAIMAYLVNYQKIGRREICSTLLDLIGRDVIKINLETAFVVDDDFNFSIEKNANTTEKINKYEKLLIKYLFKNRNVISKEILHERLYKKNLDDEFSEDFLKKIQDEAKKHDFYDKDVGDKKVDLFKIVNKIINTITTIITCVIEICTILWLIGDDWHIIRYIDTFYGLSLIGVGVLWVLKFIISFMFNITCYYNKFSEAGENDYKKWIGFKKYLKKYSSIPEHPLAGVKVWKRYYAYSISLKCSKKFYKQVKKMKIMDNSIDIRTLELFDFFVNCIGLSTKKIRTISKDKYGGSHADY